MALSVYFASALFSSRETIFNYELARRLEAQGYRVWLPQRDGFEFSDLREALAKRVSGAELAEAVNAIIYTLDMGVFLPSSNVVVAVLDEPLDEGLLIEIAYARRLGLPVIGVRTDSRTPFGNNDDPLGGIHFFAAFQCTDFVTTRPARTPQALDDLAHLVGERVRSSEPTEGASPEPALATATAQLFGDFKPERESVHSDAVLARVVGNFLEHRELLRRLTPKLVPL